MGCLSRLPDLSGLPLQGSLQTITIPKLMYDEQSYQRTLDYLYSFVDYSLTRSFQFTPDKFDLNRMVAFLEHLGNPQNSYAIVHVAGTKGKGSVSALCASALRAAGYRVGLYTSPHLQDYNERIQLDGEPIPHEILVGMVDELRPYLDQGTQLTTFEITTALAMRYFARNQADVVVLEVGLGGRLDATNVVTPKVTVITSISYDHMNVLGHTLAEIAGEKAGIIKPGVPLVLAPQVDEARHVIEQAAAHRQAPVTFVGKDYPYQPVLRSLDGQTLVIFPPEQEAKYLDIPLLGRHQVDNAATAFTALHVLDSKGFPVPVQAIRQGFARVVWPARFEVLQRQPPLVVDSAHNRDSAQKLRQALDDYFPSLPVVLIFGASDDKDVEGMLVELMPRLQQVIATRSYHPRAMEPEHLVEIAARLGCPVRQVPAVEQALEEALLQAGDQSLVLAAGSLFIAAGVRHTWFQRQATGGIKAIS